MTEVPRQMTLDSRAANLRVVATEKAAAARFRFSVLTLVSSWEKYERARSSFERNGFVEGVAEFVAIDNTRGNTCDGFGALRRAFPMLSGEYVIFAHDDVELLDDDADALWRLLEDLTARDPGWMVSGNSGVRSRSGVICRHIDDPHGSTRLENGAVKVDVLDENFLVLRASAMVFPSRDLSGFHFYGADLCLQARLAGGSCYVIPFFLRHHSSGNPGTEFFRVKALIEKKYEKLLFGSIMMTHNCWLGFGWLGKLRVKGRDLSDRLRARLFGARRSQRRPGAH